MTSSSGLSESLRKVLGVMVAAPVNGFPCSLAGLGEERSWRTAFLGSALLAAPCVWIAKMLKQTQKNRTEKKVFCLPKDVFLHQNSSRGEITLGSLRIIGFADRSCCANGSY